MFRASGLLVVGWGLACAGAPIAEAPKPWTALEREGWEQAEIVDGRPVVVRWCEPRDWCCYVEGDEIRGEMSYGEGISDPILGSRQDGDTLVLLVEGGESRVRAVGEGLEWVHDGGTFLMYPPDTLPHLEECCDEATEDEPIPSGTGVMVRSGEPCP